LAYERYVQNSRSSLEPLRLEGFHIQVQLLAKRLFDLASAILAMAFALPLGLVIAALIKLDSKGPVLFAQDQLGQGERTIRPLKFRTMHPGAEAILARILAEGGPLAEEYRAYHKLKEDPRVTRVGRILRKTSLDELPQLLNVLRGEMSLVGPRPYLPRERPMMEGREPIIRLMKPGITGFWQVMGRNETTFRKRVQMDTFYVRRWSLWWDLGLFLRTFYTVLRAKGAA
jgi:undecaprenyl-phosphate galactose phosphotransferase